MFTMLGIMLASTAQRAVTYVVPLLFRDALPNVVPRSRRHFRSVLQLLTKSGTCDYDLRTPQSFCTTKITIYVIRTVKVNSQAT